MTITVSPSAWIERIRSGRNRSPAANRPPNGARTSSTTSWRLAYSREATECPSMRQTMSGANTSAICAVPACQASKASRMIWRLASVAALMAATLRGSARDRLREDRPVAAGVLRRHRARDLLSVGARAAREVPRRRALDRAQRVRHRLDELAGEARHAPAVAQL